MTASTSDAPAGRAARAKRRSDMQTVPAEPAKKPKRARKTVSLDEAPQVTSLADGYKLPLADADAYYVPDLVDEHTAQSWHDELLGLEEWYRPTLKVYGRDVTQSRKIAAFATDRDLEVKYSGHPVHMHYEYPPLLRTIQDLVEMKLGVTFNHCMLNLYEDGNVYIGHHRDNRENRVIASLSLGAPRTLVLTHDKPPAPASSSASAESSSADAPLYSHRLSLASGSLFTMGLSMQQRWKHGIPKEPKVKQSRISLTFRNLVF
ncbi:alpha-ketoglutarate-dependent dioxygenase AlkB family protein [Rhodotorula paludigena]|uniref:alpha-ketoglutarate-dependent dioxygenase AlkB family protein n=1 Tax=Rhodotorula paludigena TaxID=86838 RepID=UPI0031763069